MFRGLLTILRLCSTFQVERRRKDTVVLLDVVQVLGDLNLSIVKGFISSDNGSFIDGMFLVDQLLLLCNNLASC